MDCGAACIKMIADYYRATISIDKIRELCEQGVLGVNMKGICNAFESLGFNVIAGKVTFNIWTCCYKSYIFIDTFSDKVYR